MAGEDGRRERSLRGQAIGEAVGKAVGRRDQHRVALVRSGHDGRIARDEELRARVGPGEGACLRAEAGEARGVRDVHHDEAARGDGREASAHEGGLVDERRRLEARVEVDDDRLERRRAGERAVRAERRARVGDEDVDLRIGHVLDAVAPASAAIRALHLGGGAMTLPRYVAATRPGSSQVVVCLLYTSPSPRD